MILDRSKAPTIQEISSVSIPSIDQYSLANGLQVYELNLGSQEIIKLEIVLNAGRSHELKKLAGRLTAAMLKEGTPLWSAMDIASKIDYYGATLRSDSNLDVSSISLFCLSKHFKDLLEILVEVWKNANFPESQIERYVKRSKQKLQIDLAKNDIVAYRELTERIFGSDHPYGFNSTPALYESIERNDLIVHHKNCYFKKDLKIFLSGKITDTDRKLLENTIGNLELNPENKAADKVPIAKNKIEKIHLKGAQDIQTAVRIGRKLFNRTHSDYPGFYLMNMVYGGYFGSRLMKNIREDKAYTYGVYSYVDSLQNSGYYSISTEVGNEYLEDTLKQIHLEMDRMCNDLVSDQELAMARNYLLGQFLNMMDGPLKVSQVLKTMILSSKDITYITDIINQIKATDKQRIRDLAQKYLRKETMWEITVGQ